MKEPTPQHYVILRERLDALGYKRYQDYLRSSHWADLKKRYRRSKLPQECVVCGNKRVQLHHRTYKRLGREWLNDVIPLCDTHHHAAHQRIKARDHNLWGGTKQYVKKARKKHKMRGYRPATPRPKKADFSTPDPLQKKYAQQRAERRAAREAQV